jgi:hypothetical protein
MWGDFTAFRLVSVTPPNIRLHSRGCAVLLGALVIGLLVLPRGVSHQEKAGSEQGQADKQHGGFIHHLLFERVGGRPLLKW